MTTTHVKHGETTRRASMPRPRVATKAQLDMLDPVRHIEDAIAEAYWKLPKSDQKSVGELLYSAREQIREANDILRHKRRYK